MSMLEINKEVFLDIDEVRHYKTFELQPPEASIFIEYKEQFHGKKVLDIGCGVGRTTHYLSQFTDQYVGIDYSDEMIRACKQYFPGLNLSVADARDLSCYKDGEFDFVIFSYNGIDYINHNDRLKVLSEINRVLRHNGYFVFSTHNRSFGEIKRIPELNFSTNPVTTMRRIRDYFIKIKNKNKNKCFEKNEKEYEIINDDGNKFSLLTYYIDRESQTKQLESNGFELVDVYEMNGKRLKLDGDSSSSCWIYYVASKS